MGSIAVLILVAYFYVQSDTGRVQLAALLAAELSGDDTTVGIERISGNLVRRFALHGLTVGDLNGEWLRVEVVAVRELPEGCPIQTEIGP
jgi:autotransporter translocation and assembly factor TamB